MSHVFDNQRPIYLQLADLFRERIVTGEWQPGTRMDSVRDLAFAYGVNPNTVQRALAELDREGLSLSERTTGRFVTEDEALIARTRHQLAEQASRDWVERMRALGLDQATSERLAHEAWQETTSSTVDEKETR